MARLLTWIPLVVGVLSTANGLRAPDPNSFQLTEVQTADTSVTVAQSGGTEVIIIATNLGGNNQNQYWNQPAMAAGQVHQVRHLASPQSFKQLQG